MIWLVKATPSRGQAVLASLSGDISPALGELLELVSRFPPIPTALMVADSAGTADTPPCPGDPSWSGPRISTYEQASSFNPQDGNTTRHFPELTPGLRNNRLLKRLILFDLDQLPLSDAQRSSPVDVGVHLIRMVATPGRPGTSSPNCLHKDGEPWTFVHLIDRDGIEGGESIVADNSRSIVFETVLDQLLDTLVVDDKCVYHMVREVYALPTRERGFRTALLIDFTPLKPDLTQLPSG